MVNLGDAEQGAHAIATAAVGNATAVAQINTGVFQFVSGGIRSGVANFTNSGTLLIDAVADASAPAGSGSRRSLWTQR